MSGLADREFGSCAKCRQKLLLNADGLCIFCELDQLREQLALKDCEIARYRRKFNDLYARLNDTLGDRAGRGGGTDERVR